MVTIRGLYNTAVCYTPELEELAENQIKAVCDQPEFAGCKIRIMPDVHAGKISSASAHQAPINPEVLSFPSLWAARSEAAADTLNPLS